MRVVRLYSNLDGDQTLCYVHCNARKQTCVNDEQVNIVYSFAGENIKAFEAKTLVIVLQHDTEINDGDFLSFGNNNALLLTWRAEKNSFEAAAPGFLSVSDKAEIWRPIKTAVLTVSDKGSRGEREDTAGPTLQSLASSLGCIIGAAEIVPDDAEQIQNAVKKWSADGFELILTTGGTGISKRDVTPDALLEIADKNVPGFGEVMRIETLKYTPRAFLTRGCAVIVDSTLVIAFPGSRRGAAQCFEAVSGAMRHAVETLNGLSAECGGK